MLDEYGFEQHANIHGRHEVAAFIQRTFFKPRPIREHPTPGNRSAHDKRRTRHTVIRAACAVHRNTTSELGHHDQDRLAPGIREVGSELSDNAIQARKTVGELTFGVTLTDMRILNATPDHRNLHHRIAGILVL